LEALPHTGAVVAVDDAERVDRLLLALGEEVTARQSRFAADGVGSLAEHRQCGPGRSDPDGPLPLVVVLVDKLEAFQAAHRDRDAGRALDLLDGLLRDGPSVGVCPVVATDRSGYTSRLASAMEHRLLLRQSDRDDWTVVGVPRDRVPGAVPPGRCLTGTDLVEAQVALLVADPASGAQGAAVARVGEAARATHGEPPPGRRPRRVDPLPTEVDAVAVERLRRHRRPAGPGVTTVGVGGDDLGPVDLDLLDIGPGWAVIGPPRSGRSTALAGVVEALAGRPGGELPVVVLTPRPSPLRGLAGEAGVLAVLSGPEIDAELPGLLDELGEGPLALVVDDAELVVDGAAVRELDRFLRGARDRGRSLLVGATTDDVLASRYRGWLADVRRSRSGLLLRPAGPADGDVFDLRLPRGLGAGWPVGRGVLVTRGRTQSVQVAVR
jgi:S-DNA-T family DNA segregation ATPase FtsK/SpoIIIE